MSSSHQRLKKYNNGISNSCCNEGGKNTPMFQSFDTLMQSLLIQHEQIKNLGMSRSRGMKAKNNNNSNMKLFSSFQCNMNNGNKQFLKSFMKSKEVDNRSNVNPFEENVKECNDSINESVQHEHERDNISQHKYKEPSISYSISLISSHKLSSSSPINNLTSSLINVPEHARNTITNIITSIHNTKTKLPNKQTISNYPLITDFSINNETFLPSLKQPQSTIDLHKNSFISGHFFQNTITSIEVSESKYNHLSFITQNYTQQGDSFFNSLTYNNIDSFINDTFSSTHPLSPIGPVQSLETFAYKYSTYENINLLQKAINVFTYWRITLIDGDSYYRVIMFQLFEHAIVNKRLQFIKEIVYDMSLQEYKDIYTQCAIYDYDNIFTLFKLITVYIQRDDIESALDVFYKAYTLTSRVFDSVLVVYCRYVIYKYIIKLQEEQNITIDINNIKQRGVEPEFLILQITPYVFEMNLKVFWVDYTFTQANSDLEQIIFENENNSIFTIGNFYYGYFPLYTNSYYNDNEYINKYISNNITPLNKLTYKLGLTNDDTEQFHCEKCNKPRAQVVFLEQKFRCCQACLVNHLDKIIKQRSDAYMKGNYLGLECKYI